MRWFCLFSGALLVCNLLWKWLEDIVPAEVGLKRNGHNVRCLVVGGYAIAFHGYPRYTKDLDVWIELSQKNADNIIEALETFGFESVELKTEDFLESDQVM